MTDPEGFLGDKRIITFEKIKNIPYLILLGNPGIGKSRATQRIALDLKTESIPCIYVALHKYSNFDRLEARLRKFEVFKHWQENSDTLHLFLDGLDEARLNDKQFDHDIIHFLKDLSEQEHNRLFLRITCRAAELPSDFVRELRSLRKPEHNDDIQLFQLTKLRELDVTIAAQQLSLDPQPFLRELAAIGATSFAAQPITLDMLLKIYQSEDQLPSNRSEIYSRGCEYLAQEISENRLQDGFQGEFEFHQRLSAARHLAATMVLCNRPRIFSGVNATVEADAIALRDSFLPDNTNWQRPEKLLRETLGTALFMGNQPNYHLWSHRSYGEYLAADFVRNADMSIEQIQSLLINSADPQHHITPELRETAAWLASMRDDVLEWILKQEPTVLLNSDSVDLTDSHKATLINRFVQAHISGIPEDYLLSWNAYKRLSYPGLGGELKIYLEDQSLNEAVRDFAMTLTVYCNVDSIDDVLIALALDPQETTSLRRGALSALKRPNHNREGLADLRPLVFFPQDHNVDSDLVALTLSILWPTHLTAEELFSQIHLPRFDTFAIGSSYDSLIGSELVRSLKTEDLPVALEWLVNNLPDHDEQLALGGQQLIASIMTKAWDNLDIDAVRIQFARIVLRRIARFSPVMLNPYSYRYFDDAGNERDYAQELRNDTQKRRDLFITMLSWLKPELRCDAHTLSEIKTVRRQKK